MTDRLVRTGLLLPAAAAWAAALGATAEPSSAVPGAAAGLVAALVLGIRAHRVRSRAAVLLVAGAIACAGVLAATAAGDLRRHPAGLPTGRPTTVEVRVDQLVPVAGRAPSGGLAERVVLRGVLVRAAGRALSVPVTLFADRVAAAPGSVVRLRTVLRPAAATDASAVLGSVQGGPVVVRAAPPAQRAAEALRHGLLARTAALPGDGGALLPGLAVGDTSRVGEDLQQAMRDSSLTHLTAVSGANCAVVVVAVLGVAAALRLPRRARVVLAGAALAGFVLLVTPQPSVVRASVMTAVGLACVLGGARAAGPPALAVTVLVLLLVDPWIAWSAGFVLSVAATAGLLLLAPPLAERLARVLPPRLALVVAVPIAAQVACQPVLLLLQPGIPVLGVLANLLAEPAAPVATVLGLIACLAGPVLPVLAGWVAALAWLPAAWIGLVARTTATLPQLGWPDGVVGALLAAGVLAAVALALVRAPRLRRVGLSALAGAALLVAGASAGGAVGRLVGTPHDWTFAACDVGQGDGLVLNGGGGRFAVVDTGADPGPIRACLARLGIARIDLLVLTHWDADHVGAAASLADRVRAVLVGPSDGPPADALRGTLARGGAPVTQVRRGDVATLGRLRLEVLWPPDPLGGVEPGNAASVTLSVTGGGASLLLTGDLGQQAQDALLAAGPLPPADVVKVAHHGSADQSPALYARVRSRIGVVSAGAGNDYGHPTRRALRILRRGGMRLVRTDQEGLVLIGWRDGRIRVWTERPPTTALWTPAK